MPDDSAIRLVFVCGGRLAGMLYSTFRQEYDVLGYVDDVHTEAYLSTTYGVPSLGSSDALRKLRGEGVKAVVSVTDAAARKRYGELLDSIGFEMMTLVFPTAVVDETARIGEGSIIRHQAVVGAQAEVGRNCVVSDLAYVGHDSIIGKHTYVSPGVSINGSVTIGEACFLGTGAVVLPERRIGDGCTVGASACVVADVPGGATVVGVPARPLKSARRTAAAPASPGCRSPLVSVLMASFNHEAYVAEAVESALQQSLEDFELIIIDDGSTDGTVDVIRGFDDPRIRFTMQDENAGLAVTKRRALEAARGTYVAILNSDDAFAPDKLERQVRVCEDLPDLGAVFTRVEVVDEAGLPLLDEDHFYFSVFEQPNRSRHEWLHHFFFVGNCLCAPSVLMRRERLLTLGYLDRRLRQLADLDLWVRLCLRHPIYVLPERLTRFRVREADANASAPTSQALVRDAWEYARVLRHYLSITGEEELEQIFPEAHRFIIPGSPLDADGIAFVVAQLALDHGGQRYDEFGLHVLFQLLEDERRAAAIQERFAFGYRDFIELTGERDVYRVL